MKTMFSLSHQMPFADLMLHPEKIEAALKATKKIKTHPAPAATPGRNFGHHAKAGLTGNR
jgi:hypothetical protein